MTSKALTEEQKGRLQRALKELEKIREILLSIEVPEVVADKDPEKRSHAIRHIWDKFVEVDERLRELFRSLKTKGRYSRNYDLGDANSAFSLFEDIVRNQSSSEERTMFNFQFQVRMLFVYVAQSDFAKIAEQLSMVRSVIKDIADRIYGQIEIIKEILEENSD